MRQAEISQLTKERLALSLKKHMAKKPLDKITVKELTEDCNLNRQTFYYHFQDIYELATWMFREEVHELLEAKDKGISWQEGLLMLLEYVDHNRAFCNRALESFGRVNLKDIFYDDAACIMQLYIKEASGNLSISSTYLSFLCDFYIEAILGQIINWLKGDLVLSTKQFMQYLEITLHNGLELTLTTASAQNI